MILLFLGDWRPTIVISISIPLSIFVSIILLGAIGETINIMTLGGLALAVGILVDDATVEIENIERNLAMGKEMRQAILDGAQQIAVPAFVSTLCICIVFVPMFFLTGVAKFLFVPLAEAVVFAMLASYLLSRTLVPTLVMYIMRGHEQRAEAPAVCSSGASSEALSASLKISAAATKRCWKRPSPSRSVRACCFLLFCVLSLGLFTSWARTSSRRWMPGCCGCTCARAPDCGLRRRRASAIRSKAFCENRFRRDSCRRSSTTSGCRTQASTCLTVQRNHRHQRCGDSDCD